MHRLYSMDLQLTNRIMKETILQPADMIEELMYHILWNEFDGKLDPSHKYFTLYVELQKLLDQENKNLTE